MLHPLLTYLRRADDRAHQRPYGDVITVPRAAVVRSFVDTSITDFDFNHKPELTAEGNADHVPARR